MSDGEQASVFSEELVASIRRDVKEVVRESVLEILTSDSQQGIVFSDQMVTSFRRDIKEVIRETVLEVLPETMRIELPNILVDISERTRLIEKAKVDAKEYMNKNPSKFIEVFKKRNKLFQGYARCKNLTNLYDECLQSNPVYIPRKFRDDKFFVRDEEELEIVKVRFMGKFQSEYNLLKKRQRDFATAVNAEDDIIYNLIDHCGVPDSVKTEIANVWEQDVKADEEKISQQWVTNIRGMKIAYEKDKQRLVELNKDRAKKFEEFRRSTQNTSSDSSLPDENSGRRIEVDDEQNRVVISISMEQEQELSEVPQGPSIDDVPSPSIAELDGSGAPEEPSTGITLPIDSISEETANETLDSSAPLFNTRDGDSSLNIRDTPDVEDFSTQTQVNIRDMAGNFSQTPATQTKKIQSNYKFRKRSHLN